MRTLLLTIVAGTIGGQLAAAETSAVSTVYKALKCPVPAAAGTWAILDRDGANRKVEPYLSSLRFGEPGVGAIVSPPFRVATDTITLTIRGHDGPQGGAKKNYVALVDVRSGKPIDTAKTFAPGNDALQEFTWNVARHKGREVRIEAHDGDSGTAFAWLGVGRIVAGPAMSVDFRNGMPPGWQERSPRVEAQREIVCGGVPFLRYSPAYSIVPVTGPVELSCGFSARRLFFLGGTVADGTPLAVYGTVEVVYRDGSVDKIPLQYGFTLDRAHKMLSPSPALYLHASGDPFQPYFVAATKPQLIDKIVLRREAAGGATPRITAVTCETEAAGGNLDPLPASAPGAEEQAWIDSHSITPEQPDRAKIEAEIRKAHKITNDK